MSSFVKFGLEEKYENNEQEIDKAEKNIKTKKKLSSKKPPKQNENQNPKKKRQPRCSNTRLRRRPKEILFKDCKDDLNHLIYINTAAQVGVRHSYIPDFNRGQFSVQNLEDLSKNNLPKCRMSELRPIYFTKKHCPNVDICFNRTIAYEVYKKRLAHARTRYHTAMKNRKIRKLEKEGMFHSTLYTFAERLESNPDPFFYGSYDFYYTGGNLCALTNEDTHNMVHVDGTDLKTLRVSSYPINKNFDKAVLKNEHRISFENDSEIFEIKSLKPICETRNLVALRQLHNTTILTINKESNTSQLLVEFKTKLTPVISFAQSSERPELFAISNMKQNLRIYDVSCMKNVNILNLYKMQDVDAQTSISWNRVVSWRDQTFLYANERQIFLMDLRTPQENWLKTECLFSNKEYPCESISALCPSEFNDIFYIGTSHKLRCIDTRYFTHRERFENVTVTEWTHQLSYPPAYIDTFRRKRIEYVACASQVAGDLRICQLTRSKNLERTKFDDKFIPRETVYSAHCLPWQPPTLEEAYVNACIAGKALQPEADLKRRIRCCTTGLSFLKNEENSRNQAALIYANSNGDIYSQTLLRRESGKYEERTNEQSTQIIADYSSNLCDLEQPNINFTDIVDLKAMRNILLCKPLNEQITKEDINTSNFGDEIDDEEKKSPTKQRFKGRWQKSVSTLHKYKDVLAQDLLSIWDIPYEEENDIKLSTLNKKFKAEKSTKDIFNWLNSDQNELPTTSVPLANLSTSAIDMDVSGFDAQPQSTQLFVNDSFVSQKEENITIQNTSRTKNSKPKKKHIKGF